MMLATEKTNVIIIYGPTVTGKTALAIYLAKKYNGELISADSRQVYRGLDVGSGKVSFDSKIEKHQGFWIVDGVKINGFDLVSPQESFTAADFIEFASTTMDRIIKAGKLTIIVGGTGFYIYAFLNGIESIGIQKDSKLRSELEKLTQAQLFGELQKLDPKRAGLLNQSDRQNPRRLIRAIEIAVGRPKITPAQNPNTLSVDNLVIGLTAPNDFIYKRADKWIDERFEKIIDEIKNLLEHGVGEKWLENLGLEYRWGLRYIRGDISEKDSVTKLKFDIHSFIRRQKTWFQKFEGMKLFDITTANWREELEKTTGILDLRIS